MRLRRKLWFRVIKRLKWELIVLLSMIIFVNSLYRKVFYNPIKISSICEPIDVVYTWVNGSDSEFLSSIREYDRSFDSTRFDDKNELKYSLRSLEKFAPWVRHIYIVTNGQIPKWLDLTNERVSIVPHEILVPDTNLLPTFSSSAIETFIHRIPNLSERYIYFNDDIFLGSNIYPEDFYSDSEGVRIYQAWLVPDCAEDCPWTYIGDGACDRHCCIEACQYDGGDCTDDPSHSNNMDSMLENIANKTDSFKLTNSKNIAEKHDIPHSYNNPNGSSFKNVLLQHKNLTYVTNFKNVVNDFNKNVQSISHAERKLKVDNNPHFTSIESNSSSKSEDIYSHSLIYTNMFLNREYGFKARNVIAHVGFLLEKEIIKAMHQKFQQQIANTAKNRFRAANDLQFALAYYSFVMEETRRATVEEIFNEFDTDKSLTWSDREIRTFLAKTFPLPLDWSTVRFFEEVIHNCSHLQDLNNSNNIQYTTVLYERYEDSNLPTITRDLVKNCNPLAEALEENFSVRRKYNYNINSRNNLRNNFMMLTSNITEVVNGLDKIRKNLRKFNCINDNLDINYTEDNKLIRHLLEDFYLSLFPHRSQFELSPEYRNRFQNWRDYVKWRRQQKAILTTVYIISILILAYLVRSICIHKAKFVSRYIQKL